MANPRETDERIARLGAVLEALAGHPDEAVRRGAAELVEGVRWLHAEGLGRLVDLVAEEKDLFRRALDDPHVANLLLLHDLVVVDERSRALEALESVRPFLRGHGGEVELVGIEEGVVRVRLLGACHGCPSSTATLRQGIERALAEHLPGYRGLEVAGVEGRRRGSGNGAGDVGLDGGDRRAERERQGEPVSYVPIDKLVALEERVRGEAGASDDDGGATRPGPREARLGPLDDFAAGALHGLLADDYPILLLRRAGKGVIAYRNACPGSILPLHLGAVDDGIVTCPWHGCRFELASGARVGGSGPPLHRLAARVVDGEVWVGF